MRLAGTWKQYSAKAISQLTTITLNKGAWRYLRWPYQAKVMKILERVSNRIVVIRICCLISFFRCTCGSRRARIELVRNRGVRRVIGADEPWIARLAYVNE